MRLYLVALLALLSVAAWSQVKQGKSRPLETKTWMKTVNGPHCSALAKMMKAGPADDKEWEAAATHAQMLSESGYVLMGDGRCPDAIWAEASKTLQDSGAEMAKAVAAKNTAEAQAAMQKILGSCKSCHAAHKK
jgi:cytochrome c556